jgi:TM2 domain-containing membrane protein YozV
MSKSSQHIVPPLILCALFGVLGVHRFYLQKFPTAALQMLTLGGLGIWTLVDLVQIASGNFTDDLGFKIRWA